MLTLANQAVPKYYGEFRDKVLAGEIPVNNEVSLEMNRIDALIADPDIYYDPKPVEGYIRYCEGELCLTDGSALVLLDTFKLWAEQIFCWYHYVERKVFVKEPDGQLVRKTKLVKKRLTVKQYLIVARGAAKSMYAFTLQAYFLNMDTSTTHQITTSPTMKQSEEVMSPFRTSITRARGPLFRFLTEGSVRNTSGSEALRQKLVSTKKGIENFLTGSLLEVRPMTVNKLQGLRPKIATIDEWLSGDIREDVIGAIEQGASKEQSATKANDYLIVAISSEGTVRNGAGDTVKMELKKILNSEYFAPHISIWHYKLDKIEEVANPYMWFKANPNLELTVSMETYQLDVERAEAAPASRNDILAKRFGIPMEGFTYFFTYEETEVHPSRRADFWGLPCALGADLSHGDDFCAFTFLFPLSRGEFGVKTRSYITKRTYDRLQPAMMIKYDEFIKEGSLIIMENNSILDLMEVYEDLFDGFIIPQNIDVRCLGFDPWGAREFVARYELEYGPYGLEKVQQGAKTESVPLGELKKLAEDKALIFDQALMSFAMGNAVVMEDTNGNRKLVKKRADEKIDNVAALLDALVAYKLNKEAFD